MEWAEDRVPRTGKQGPGPSESAKDQPEAKFPLSGRM